jgi:hypothetical protein
MGIFAMLREMPRIIKRNIGQPENWGCSIKKTMGFPKENLIVQWLEFSKSQGVSFKTNLGPPKFAK